MAQPRKQPDEENEWRQALEVGLADMETRMRQLIQELLQPTIHRTTTAVADLDTMRGLVSQHARAIQEVQLGQLRSVEQVSTILSFKEEMSRWDAQRRAHEASIDEKQETMVQKLDAQRYNLEQKESALHHLNRNVDRVALELNRILDEQEEQKSLVEQRLDEQSKKINKAKTELEVRLMGLEMKHNALTDEVWGEETGLAKVAGELQKTNMAFASLQENVTRLEAAKAEAEQLEKLRSEVSKMVHDANASVTAMRQSVGNVVNDVREHFRTAAQTISAHNATFIGEVRGQHQEELARAAALRDEVQEFVNQTAHTIAGLDARVAEAAGKASSLAAEAREEVEELNKRRKRDKAAQDNELKALKKRMGGVFNNSDMVLHGIEHIYSVLQMMLEGELIDQALGWQDSVDRKKIALMGVKEDEALLCRTSQMEPQHPRPECRVKSAPASKPPGTLRGGPNDKKGLAKTQEPVVRVDNRCLSCSGQAPLVLSAFKMACLQYSPSPVEHGGVQHDRDDLLQTRAQLLEKAHKSLLEGPPGGTSAAATAKVSAPEPLLQPYPPEESEGDAFSQYAAMETMLQGTRSSAQTALRLPNLWEMTRASKGGGESLSSLRALTAR